jgi:hypothetical protein
MLFFYFRGLILFFIKSFPSQQIFKIIIFTMNMKATNLKSHLPGNYLGFLKNLSPENKRALIKALSNSLKNSKKPVTKSLDELFGAFVSDKSADEIISDIKSSRPSRE